MNELLRVEGFELQYPDWKLRVAEFILRPGDRAVLMGPSGIGKSSFLRWLCGLPLGGTVSGKLWIAGKQAEELLPERRGFGVLFQDPLLLPHLSVRENVELGLRFRGISEGQRSERVQSVLASVGLQGLAHTYPDTLSGGEKTRVALARALVLNPSVLLLDEPFASLNTDLRSDLRTLLKRQVQDQGLALVLVSHDEEDARVIASQTFDFRDHGPTSQERALGQTRQSLRELVARH